MKTLLAYIRLTRPANVITAIADILAGIAVAVYASGIEVWSSLTVISIVRLSLATIGLYGGGVVMNDVADSELDSIERPERPIPSGFASKGGATVLGLFLLVAGVFFASQVSETSFYIASFVALLALLYDFIGKHNNFFGPINMGLCRGGNLLLGMSASIEALKNYYFLAVIPIIYISAITMISRGEVVGGNKVAIRLASIMYAVVVIYISSISFFCHEVNFSIQPFIFIALFTLIIYRPLIAAYKNPEPMNIRNAVKTGVISIIIMDSSIAALFAGWEYALIVLALLPVSILLAKVFAVT